MIGRGRHNDIVLFEITQQDLMDPAAAQADYAEGNVLLYQNDQDIRIGQELARADDLACAWEFLADGHTPAIPDSFGLDVPEGTVPVGTVPEGTVPIGTVDLDHEISQLNRRIEQRDGLLSELVEKLRLERDENGILSLLLEQTQSQLALDAASRDELMEDLQQASANTMLVETNLEHLMEEKYQLEQELAERITDLLETSMVNDDLRRKLDFSSGSTMTGSAVEPAPDAPVFDSHNPTAAEPLEPPPVPGSQSAQAQVFTMSGGKQIHIYHEFPTMAKPSISQRLRAFSWLVAKAACVVTVVLALTLVLSVAATSLTNDISYGQALDLILKNGLSLIDAGR